MHRNRSHSKLKAFSPVKVPFVGKRGRREKKGKNKTFDLDGNPFFVCDTCFRGCQCKMAPTYWWIQLAKVSRQLQGKTNILMLISVPMLETVQSCTKSTILKYPMVWSRMDIGNVVWLIQSLFVFDWMLIKSYCFWETKLSKKNIWCSKKTIDTKSEFWPVLGIQTNRPNVKMCNNCTKWLTRHTCL